MGVDLEVLRDLFAVEITTVGILWALHASMLWRAVEQPGSSRFLGWALMVMNVLAFVSVSASLLGLLALVFQRESFAEGMIWWSVVPTALFATTLAAYYCLVTVSFTRRPRA